LVGKNLGIQIETAAKTNVPADARWQLQNGDLKNVGNRSICRAMGLGAI
jgi:hypothetical protein